MPIPLLATDGAVLAVIDVQERLMAAMPRELRGHTVANVVRLARGARLLGVPILFTEQYPKGLGPTVKEVAEAIAGDSGVLDPSGSRSAAGAIDKLDFSCQRVERFRDAVRESGCSRLILCGAEAHVCVLQTAIDALRDGLAVQIVADAICSRQATHRDMAVTALRDAGAVVLPAESILFGWLQRAGGPAFKEISKMVK